MSQSATPNRPLLRAQIAEGDAGGRPVTDVRPVPASRGFPQSPRMPVPRGRPVTSAGLCPLRGEVARGADAAAHAPARARALRPPGDACAPASLDGGAGMPCCRSSGSWPSTARADTSHGTRSTAGAMSYACPSSLDDCRGAPLSRLHVPARPVVTRGLDLYTAAEWISRSPPLKGPESAAVVGAIRNEFQGRLKKLGL